MIALLNYPKFGNHHGCDIHTTPIRRCGRNHLLKPDRAVTLNCHPMAIREEDGFWDIDRHLDVCLMGLCFISGLALDALRVVLNKTQA